ncbi:MAG: LacI family DNA-binding transcriptional regulator [Caulobacterales bacterium]
MKVTLHEVAARADVSIATVSRAVNGLAVSPASLAKVREAIAELGYVANDAARALRSDRSHTMGIIFSDLRNTLGIDLLDGLSDTIEEAGYSLIIATARGDAHRFDVLMHRFLERRVDALFCIRPPGKVESLPRYAAAKVPVMAMFGASGAFSRLPNMSPSFSEPAAALAEHLRALGHRRIAILQPQRRAAGMDAIGEILKGEGLGVEAVEMAEGVGTAEIVRSLISRADRSTVVLVSDPAVRGVMAACAALGVETPGDLSLVSLNDITSGAYHRKHGLSSVTVDPQRMGRACGAAMLAWLAGSRPADRTQVQSATFHPRTTTGAAPALASRESAGA